MTKSLEFDELRISSHLAWRDLRSRYAHTVLGPWWSMLNLAVVLLGSSVAVALISGTSPRDQAPRLAVGLAIWTLISNCLSEASGLFEAERGILFNSTITESTVALQLVIRNGIVFLHNSLVVLATFLVCDKGLPAGLILLLPILLLTMTTLVIPVILVARWSIIISDLKVFLPSIVQFSFFLTPVLWSPPDSGLASRLTVFNPLSWPIEVTKLAVFERNFISKYVLLLIILCVLEIAGYYFARRRLQSIRKYL